MLQTQDLVTRTFQVGEQPKVIIQNRAGNIQVKRGNGNQVEVRATVRADWTGNRPEVRIECVDGNTVQASVHYEWSWKAFGGCGDVHFEVLVPATVDLELSTHAGSIGVQGVYGQVELHSNAGELTVSQTTLVGRGAFQTNAGSIHFSGVIDPQAAYTFQTNAGSVDLTVPEDSGLHVDGHTDVGGVHSSFPLMIERYMVGGAMRGDTGSEPRASISLHTNAGSVSLRSGRVA